MAETIEERLTGVWARTDRIFAMLGPDAWLAQPIALRHPFIFYVGHLPAFAWNHVCAGVLEQPAFNPFFDEMFSRGIDPDVDDPTCCHDHPDLPDRWPSLDEVLEYRDRVRGAVLESIPAVCARADVHLMAGEGRVFSMVIEHELMHQETLLYMLQRLSFADKVRPDWLPSYVLGTGRSPAMVHVPAGEVSLGAAFPELAFGWDNEFPAHQVLVPGFDLASMAVTNRQFLDFVENGGYRRSELWHAEDWQWLGHEPPRHPTVWEERDGRWFYRTLFDLIPLEDVEDWPVFASLAEARAYVRSQGQRLLTEAEFHRAAFGHLAHDARPYPWGETGPSPERGNFDFQSWAPTPTGSHPQGASAWGVHDLMGDGWEWTETAFAGLPGFTPYIPGYPGYSADFFDGKHYVLKGASWATARDLIRPSFRNWFQAHYPYVFAKFRGVARP